MILNTFYTLIGCPLFFHACKHFYFLLIFLLSRKLFCDSADVIFCYQIIRRLFYDFLHFHYSLGCLFLSCFTILCYLISFHAPSSACVTVTRTPLSLVPLLSEGEVHNCHVLYLQYHNKCGLW